MLNYIKDTYNNDLLSDNMLTMIVCITMNVVFLLHEGGAKA